MAQSEQIRVQLKDLSQMVVRDVHLVTASHALPIVCDHTRLGSGTLVQIDGWEGILSAEHVVRHPTQKDLRLTYTGHPERFSGFLAWLLWVGVHLYFLIGFANRFFVLVQWGLAFLTKRRRVRVLPE
jgi:hypothetical protein